MMLNEKLRALKKKSRLTALELSRKSGVPLPTIHKLLSGETTNPKYDTLMAVAEAFGYQLNLTPQPDQAEESFTEREKQLVSLYRQLTADGQTFFNGQLLQFMHYEKKQK